MKTNIKKSKILSPTLDFAFCDIKELQEIIFASPNLGERQSIPKFNNDINDLNALSPQLQLTKLLEKNKKKILSQPNYLDSTKNHNKIKNNKHNFETNSIRLCYNNISSLNGLINIFDIILKQPYNLIWIDLSHNNLKIINDELLQIKSLKILYLHHNKIKSKNEVSKLKSLPNLKKLTLYGNPIETKKYRSYIIALFPDILCLDFNRITNNDKELSHQIKLNK